MEEELRWSGKMFNDHSLASVALPGEAPSSRALLGFAVNADYAVEMGKVFIVPRKKFRHSKARH